MFKIQYIHGRRPIGVDEGDLPWQDCGDERRIDYTNLVAVLNEATSLDDAFDGRYTHRVIER